MADDKYPVEIDTPHGSIRWKQIDELPPPNLAEIVHEITPEESRMLRADADAASQFIQRYVPLDQQPDDLLLNLDLAFSSWLHSTDPGKEQDQRVIRIIGASYGQYCIEQLGVRWAEIKDEQGADIALTRENPTTQSFPFTSIQYRIEDKKTDFIYALFASLNHLIEAKK